MAYQPCRVFTQPSLVLTSVRTHSPGVPWPRPGLAVDAAEYMLDARLDRTQCERHALDVVQSVDKGLDVCVRSRVESVAAKRIVM